MAILLARFKVKWHPWHGVRNGIRSLAWYNLLIQRGASRADQVVECCREASPLEMPIRWGHGVPNVKMETRFVGTVEGMRGGRR